MTPEAQRIAVALLDGWTYHDTGTKHYYEKPGHPRIWTPAGLPDYLNDLNAMHEAENALTPTKRGTMACVLTTFTTPGYDWGFATAAQRAEAFLRATGKWNDNP